MNTVHVDDVSRALWHLTAKGNNGEIYNLVDQGETSKSLLVLVTVIRTAVLYPYLFLYMTVGY